MNKRIQTPMACVLSVLVLLGCGAAARASAPSVFEQIDLLIDVRHELVQGYVEEPDQARLIEAALKAMVEALGDPYTSYLTRDELDPFGRYVRGTFTGIGAEIDLHESRPRIVTPLEGSPAWNAGVMAGDVILEIDGESTLDLSLPDTVTKLTGEKGTQVRIKVRHESGEEQDLTITRDVINIQTVRGFRRNGNGQYDLLIDDERRIGYVRVTQFTERTAGELRAALESLKNKDARGLILDMRFNPGGLLPAAVEVSDMFLTGGKPIVSVKGRVVPEQRFDATDQTILSDIPIVVIANEASASAAEIVTGALADNERALFVGARTFGKGSVQQVKMLESGNGALKFTNAYYYIPSGRLIHRREDATEWGVDPHEGCYVPMSPEQVREMIRIRREADVLRRDNDDDPAPTVTAEWIEQELKDPQMAAALKALLGKLEDDAWPQVGESGRDILIRQSREANLRLRRDLLRERLAEVERELDELAVADPVDLPEDAAVAEEPAAVSPTDPAAVQQQVEDHERRVLDQTPVEQAEPSPTPAEPMQK